MVNFYRKLIPQAADVLLPLTEAIKHNPAAKTLEVGPPEKEAFVKIKDILAEVSALTHPDPNTTLSQIAQLSCGCTATNTV